MQKPVRLSDPALVCRINDLIRECKEADEKDMPDLAVQKGIMLAGMLEGLVIGRVINIAYSIYYLSLIPKWVQSQVREIVL